MKKIIATVLAMVMALALCTTAFAATHTLADNMQLVNSNADAVSFIENATAGYWMDSAADKWNNTGKTIVKVAGANTGDFYWSAVDSNSADLDIYYVWNKDTKKFDQITVAEQAVIAAGYTKQNLIVSEIVAAATCADNGYKVTVYTDLNESATYVKADDVKAYNDKQTVEANKITVPASVVYFGSTSTAAIGYYNTNALGGTHILNKGHILVKDGTTYGTAKLDVYKCALCGARFVTVRNSETGALKNEYYDYKNAAEVAAYANANGVVSSKLLKNAATLYTVEAGSTTTKPADGANKSPKTFDAGIAMYVGMALTSVAGSAVVIGKKKEF